MLSKNNFQERLRKMEPKKERFSIRKFSVGAASVLIGFTIFGMQHGENVKADTVNADKLVKVDMPKADEADQQNDASVKADVAATDQVTNQIQDNDAKQKASTELVDAQQGTDLQSANQNQTKNADEKSENQNSNQNQQTNDNAIDTQSTEAKSKKVENVEKASAQLTEKAEVSSTQTQEKKNNVKSEASVKADDVKIPEVKNDVNGDSFRKASDVTVGAKDSKNALSDEENDAVKAYQAAADKLDADVASNRVHGAALEAETTKVGRMYDSLSQAAKEAIQAAAVDEAKKHQNPNAGNTGVKTKYAGGFRNIQDGVQADGTFALPEKTTENTAQVSNYHDFSAALVNKNIHYIELQGEGLKFDDNVVKNDQSSINNGGVGAEGISSRNAIPHYEIALNKVFSSQYDNIGRQLVIEGQGQDKTTLDMGKWYFSFWNSNNKDGNHSWKITLKDLTFKTDAAEYKAPSPRAPFVFNGKSANGSSVNLVNVNADFGQRDAGLVNSNDKVAANVKDSTITATGTVIKNGQNVVLDGVTANISNGSLVYTSGNLTIKGKNSVTDDLKSKSNDAFIAKNVDIKDNAELDLNITNSAVGETDADIDLAGKNNNVFYIGSNNVKTASLENPSDNGNFTVGKNAKITLNSANVTKSDDGSITATKKGIHNLRFMYNVNGQGGNFVVKQGANVDLNMGTGHSMAIWAGNLQIDQGATVNIATLQNNNKNYGVGAGASVTYNGFHYAPITLGMVDRQIGDIDLTGKNSTDAEINGTLRIIRGQKNQDIDVQSPLIAFGSGSTNEKQTFTLNVNEGATLDLQDSSSTAYDTDGASPIAWNKALDWIGTNANVNRLGLITMFGTGATNNITFNAPQYINLQRRGSQIGSALRTEGLHNHIIAKDSSVKGTPLAQWMGQNQTETPDEAWRIQNLDTQVAGGNYYSNFLPSGAKAGDKGGTFFTGAGYLKSDYFGTPFDKSQGTAEMAPFMGNYKFENGSYTGDSMAGVHGIGLTQLTNDFTWWAPRRITFGENGKIQINNAVNYEAETQAINKTTKDKVSDLNKQDLKDGIKDIKASDNTVAQDHKAILGDKSLINWDDSKWGLDWSKTDFTEDGKLRKDPSAKLTTAQQNIYNALKKISEVAPVQNADGTYKLPELDKDGKPVFNGKVATIVYTDSTAEHPSVDFVLVPINVTEHKDSDDYTPSYKPVDVKKGESATSNPSFTDGNNVNVKIPEGTSFATNNGTPTWATINSNSGVVTVTPEANVTSGAYNIPVTVTYKDGSKDITNVPVFVTDGKGDQTVDWDKNGATVVTVDPLAANAHETSVTSQVIPAKSVVKSVESYKIDKDGKIATKGTAVTPSSINWKVEPSTVVTEANANGKNITGNTIKVVVNGKTIITNPFDIDAKGAGAKSGAKVDVDFGKDLTDAQFKALVDNNIPADEIVGKVWKTKPDENGNGGVIEITFSNKDKNGNPTHLDINIPAENLNIHDDAKSHDPQTKPISTPQGEKPEAPSAITNIPDLPQDTKITWTNPTQVDEDVKTPGVHTETITVTYPDTTKDTVTTKVIVDAAPKPQSITTEVGAVPDASKGIANLNNGGDTPVDGYPSSAEWTTKPDTSKSGFTTGTVTVHYPDGTSVPDVTIPVAVSDDHNVNIIDDKGHTYSLHVQNVVTHKTSDNNIIGNPVVDSFKLSYYEGGQNYSKPYIYTLKGDHYELTQVGDAPKDKTVDAPGTVSLSDISAIWTPSGDFSDQIPGVQGNGQPSSIASETNNGTGTIVYDNDHNTQGKDGYVYPKYPVSVDTSKVNWPVFGRGPKASHPFPFVTIYGANGIDGKDIRSDEKLPDASGFVTTDDLDNHGFKPTSIAWKNAPDLSKADAKAKATVELSFKDGSHLDVPVTVNVIKVDQGVNNQNDHDVYRDITRTINVEGQQSPTVQHVVYSRARITDMSKPADQQVTYTDWVAGVDQNGNKVTNFGAVNITKPGYNAIVTGNVSVENKDNQQFVLASETITPDSKNQVVNVTYSANEHTQVINYVDNSDKTTVVGHQDITGKTGESVDVTLTAPENWQVVGDQNVPDKITFGSEEPKSITVYVEHKTENINVDKDNWDTYRTVTQNINEKDPVNGNISTARTITLTYQRTGVKDLVTGETKWNDWVASKDQSGKDVTNFPEFDVTRAGYKATSSDAKIISHGNSDYVAASETINPDALTKNNNVRKVLVTYVANGHTYTINYEDKNSNKIIGSYQATGKTGQSVTLDVPGHVPAGWELVPGTKYETSITFGSNDPAAKTVFIQHKIDTTDGRQHQDDSDVYRKVTRTVTVNIEGQEPQTVNQDLYFYRTKSVDEALKAEGKSEAEYTTYGTWTSNMTDGSTSFTDVEIPDDAGYTMTVTGGSVGKKNGKNYVLAQSALNDKKEPVANINVTVDYKKADQSFKINFVNKDNHNDVVGTQTVSGKMGDTVKLTVDGVNGSTKLQVPEGWTIVGGNPTITTTFGNKKLDDQTIYVEHKTDITDGRQHQDDSDVYRKVTRTVIEEVPGATQPGKASETLEFYRIKSHDEVTGKDTYSAWTSNMTNGVSSFREIQVPTVPGCTAVSDDVKLENGYVPAQSALKNGTPVDSYTVTVKYTAGDQSAKINYVDANDHSHVVGTQIVSGKTGETVSVTPKVPNNWQIVGNQQVPSSITFGSTPVKDTVVYVEHKTEDVTNDPNLKDQTQRDVKYQVIENFNGKKTTVVNESAHFTRTATKDLVTKEITYGNWNGTEVKVPETNVAKQGYTAHVGGSAVTTINGVTLTPDFGNKVVTVTYTKDSDTPVKFDPNNDQMTKDVTRTVIIEEPGKPATTVTQTVHFTTIDEHGNGGYKDPATGEIHYNQMHVDGDLTKTTGTWDAVPVSPITTDEGAVWTPQINGKTVTEVPANNDVKPDTVPTNVTVKYVETTTPIKYDGTKEDMYKEITRTITAHVPNAEPVVETQTVKFSREDDKGNAGYIIDGVTKMNDWHAVDGNAWAEYKAPEIKGYTPDKSVISAETVTPATSSTEVSINYKRNADTPIQMDKNNKDYYKEVTRTITVNYPAGQHNEQQPKSQTVIFTREDKDGNAGYVDAVTGKTILNDWHVEGGNAKTGTWAEYDVPEIKGYTPTQSKVGSQIVTPTTKPSDVTINYIKDGSKPVPYEPGKPGVNDDMNNYVTHTIHIEVPGQETQDVVQTIHFTRKDKDGNAGYKDPATGVITWNEWHVAGSDDTTGTFEKYEAPEIKGYTPDKTEIPEINNVTPGMQIPDTTINYTKNPSDAEKYDPEPKVITVKPGETPKAEDGIGNKDQLPTDTTYTFKDGTPDTTKPGETSVTIVVTYPDGSKDEVPTIVKVTEVKTDADKNEPTGKVITVDPGETPKAEDGISNKDQLPTDTTYTFKDGTPDTTKPGDKPVTIVVTYPDGSKDEVPTTVHVNEPKKNDDTTKPSNPEQPTVPDGGDNGDQIPDTPVLPEQPTAPSDDNNNETSTVEPQKQAEPTKNTSTKKNSKGGKKANTVKPHAQNNGAKSNGNVKGQGAAPAVSMNNKNNGAGNGNNGVNSDKNAKTLPQTGEKQNKAGIFGLMIASIAGLLGLAGADKKRKHN